MEEEYPDPIPMTEKDKRDFKFNNRGKEVFGPLDGIFSSHNKKVIIKDYSTSPSIFSAISKNAKGVEKKEIVNHRRGIEKKYQPLVIGFEVRK
jgi:hypothetical protein